MTPHRELTLIKGGNGAAVVGFLGAILGFSLPLASAAANSVSIVDFVLWAIIGAVVQIAAFFVASATMDHLAAPDHRWRDTGRRLGRRRRARRRHPQRRLHDLLRAATMTYETKRSRRIAARRRHTLALGSIAAAGLTLAACDSAPDGDYAFTSIAECRTAGFSETVCDAEYNEALRRHAEDAPRFEDQAACEAEFGEGRCPQVTPQGSQQSYFAPFLTGFLVSQALRNVTGYGAYRSYRDGNAGYAPAPIYRNRSGQNVTVTRDAPEARPQTRPVNANTRTAARGGFGGRSYSRGFGG